jgi:DNA (cytosine-5)-methyltransferase 1
VPFVIQERAVSENPNNGPQGKGWQEGVASTLEARNKVQSIATSGVRRLTPRECERLQGFPDDFTLVPYRGKPAADGPRYRAIGNSMAVPVLEWIGRRIQIVNGLRGVA